MRPSHITNPFPSVFHGPSHLMSAVPSASTSHSNFASIFNAALEKYKRKTKQDLAKHPLLPRLQSCDSPEAILTVLRDQTPGLNQSDDGLTTWVAPTVNVLYSFSTTLGGFVRLVNIRIFPYHIVQSNIYLSGNPTGEYNLYRDWHSSPGPCVSRFPCTTYFDIVTQAAKNAHASRDKLVDILNCIERYFQRLEIYTAITPTTAMTDIIVDIMAEVLTILAMATKEVKRGRLSESMLCRFTILDLTDTSVQRNISGS
jgi:hypothetical protein